MAGPEREADAGVAVAEADGLEQGANGHAGGPASGDAADAVTAPSAAPLVTPRPAYRPRAGGWARWAPAAATALCIGTVVAITLWQLHPNLLFSNTTTTGGDTGAHYAMPLFLRNVLLPHLHVTGWDPGWYDGFPLYTYYFVLPDLWAAITSYVIPYNLAFKWATVMGSVAMPVCAWAMGRLFRLRVPVPAVLAVATLPFLFDYTWTIYGGNLFSTLAGEYSFSLGLALALLFLGLFAWGIRTGRRRGWTAVVLAVCIAAHIIPALFALGGAAVLTALELLPSGRRLSEDGFWRFAPADQVQRPLRALWWGASTTVLGLLLSGWWLVPFGLLQSYSNSMGYTNIPFHTMVFPVADRWVVIMAAVALLIALATLSRFGILLSVLGGASALAMLYDPQGKLYNARFLPFWFLCAYLLAGWLVAVTCAFVARTWRRARHDRWARLTAAALEYPGGSPVRVRRPRPALWAPGAVGGALIALVVACAVVVPPFAYNANGDQWPSWLPWPVHFSPSEAQVSGWAAYNYVGVEGQHSYPELRAIESTMQRVGRSDGCGRAMWEYNQSELSVSPSDPQVGLPYGPLDVALGVEHLQLLGVRYYMASSPETQQQADADPALTRVAKIGPFTGGYNGQVLHTTWVVYRVAHSNIVTPLSNRPVVLKGVGQSQSSWLAPSVAWYDDPSDWNVLRTAGGPAGWARAPAGGHRAAVRVPATRVSDVQMGNESISFHVSRVGTPVLVKMSYFPDWHASGADGPWRAMPNLMVVVPTSHEVTLTYGGSTANHLGATLTAVGVLSIAVPFGWRWWRRRAPRRTAASVVH